MRIRTSPFISIALLTCVVLYAGLLRFDALFQSYGPYDRPGWLSALQPHVRSAAGAITPDWRWRHVDRPYVGGDPVNYLKFAREMRSFYAAHVREPGFPGATRLALMAIGDADVGVSLASIAFALLTLVATFALGCAIASPVAGLAAAAALGIDQTAVYWAVGGWRDEMFAFFAVFSAWAWIRLAQRTTYPRALVAGLASGGAVLTRITSLSLLAPAVIFLLARRDPARRHPRHVGLAIAVAAAIAGPFLVNCAIATGDPFYAINNHTVFYLNREGTAEPPPTTAVDYTLDKFRMRPIAAADTVATGIFLYPFENKWVGLDKWVEGLGSLLALLAVAGLVAWLWQPDGRLLLFMLFGALVPFSVTWTVVGGAEWRLTLFAYAFQLLAAFWLVETVVRTRHLWRQLTGRQILRPAVVVACLATIVATWTYAVPYAVAKEALEQGAIATIPAGHRDRWFFGRGWSHLVVTGNVVSRFALEPTATARLLLPDARPYTLVLRLEPLHIADTSPQRVDVAINDAVLGTLELTWNHERIGEYRLDIPATAVRPGFNELAFRSQAMLPIGRGAESFPTMAPDRLVGFRLWYVRIVPRPPD